MAWLSIRVRASAAEADAVSAAFAAAGSAALSLEAADDELLCEDPGAPESSEPLWAQTWVCALFSADTVVETPLVAVVQALGRYPVHTVTRFEDEDWEAAVRAHFPPRHFPPRLWIYPSWEPAPLDQHARVELDPGMAFGTGQHPTTALCLGWLSRQSEHWSRPPSVLDYGCGSGILAIAALKLGAQRAWGIDIDPTALEVARANATRNHIGSELELSVPRPVPPPPADIVLANILARPLVLLAPLLMNAVQPGGSLLLSGFTPSQAPAVAAAFPGFALEPHVQDDWVLLCGGRLT
ncbi:MAG TPA: 50S ribosomal protein L11 methyltransferase [Acidiferrobacteraceae bacterium]|nr:50S ribosomal protein L11 methyltransferase [Acidiferrobacteraceae bacterium]